jgi:hypoxanthine-DNA glycosylase
MSRIQGFAPVSSPAATRLVLGSMPGRRSLADGQYYAHPRNAFWPIMGALFDFDPVAPYPMRCDALRAAGIALWDVLGECERPTSLDADIVDASIRPNDFGRFLAGHRHIARILFNGAKAQHSFERHVLPGLDAHLRQLPRTRLPSTSPAHAGMRFEDKLAHWRAALRP